MTLATAFSRRAREPKNRLNVGFRNAPGSADEMLLLPGSGHLTSYFLLSSNGNLERLSWTLAAYAFVIRNDGDDAHNGSRGFETKASVAARSSSPMLEGISKTE